MRRCRCGTSERACANARVDGRRVEGRVSMTYRPAPAGTPRRTRSRRCASDCRALFRDIAFARMQRTRHPIPPLPTPTCAPRDAVSCRRRPSQPQLCRALRAQHPCRHLIHASRHPRADHRCLRPATEHGRDTREVFPRAGDAIEAQRSAAGIGDRTHASSQWPRLKHRLIPLPQVGIHPTTARRSPQRHLSPRQRPCTPR